MHCTMNNGLPSQSPNLGMVRAEEIYIIEVVNVPICTQVLLESISAQVADAAGIISTHMLISFWGPKARNSSRASLSKAPSTIYIRRKHELSIAIAVVTNSFTYHAFLLEVAVDEALKS
jgi:hypothetical protein